MTVKKRILLADDDPRNVFALKAVLQANGYDVVSAKSMIDVFHVLETGSHIDIILLDMMMPDMDGYEGVKKIKQSNRFQHLPVVAVTAQAMRGDREKCLAAGADDYIPKPVDVDNLHAILSKWL